MIKKSITGRIFTTQRLPRYFAAFLLVSLFAPLCGRCAAAEPAKQPIPAIYLSERLQGPTPPTRPLPPAKPSLKGRQDKPAPPPPVPATPHNEERRPAAQKIAPPKERKAEPPRAAAESSRRVAEEAPESARDAVIPASEAPSKNTTKSPVGETNGAQEQDRQFNRDWIKNTLYFLLIFAVCGVILYIHHSNPPQKKKPPAKAMLRPRTTRQADAAPPFPTETFSPRIKNKSLLEQLVKYDMETYGELRSTLDYDQPAYVELLIRKYGGGDEAKINRAIHLFHQRRGKQ